MTCVTIGDLGEVSLGAVCLQHLDPSNNQHLVQSLTFGHRCLGFMYERGWAEERVLFCSSSDRYRNPYLRRIPALYLNAHDPRTPKR